MSKLMGVEQLFEGRHFDREVNHASGEPIGDAKAPLDLAQRQNPAVRRQQPAVEFDHNRLAARG
jgi:hypothetical protein